jgi:YD repeat-containing protein
MSAGKTARLTGGGTLCVRSIINSYVSNENNIYRKTFDHRTSDPYNEYTYDDLDRPTSVTYHDSDTEAFNMDDLGNRDGNQTLRDDGTVNFVVDDDTNRYTSIGGNSITLSAAKSRSIGNDAGNLTTDKDGYMYEPDEACPRMFLAGENRIVKIEDSSTNDIAEYAHDALGRRTSIIDSKAGTTTLYYGTCPDSSGSDMSDRSDPLSTIYYLLSAKAN